MIKLFKSPLVHCSKLGLLAVLSMAFASSVWAQLLITEVVVTPTAAEFIEIHNPGGAPVDLSNVYLTDATFAGGGTFYYNIVTGTNAGGGGFSDFHARFPDGASIPAGAYQTVAISGSDGFFAQYGVNPTYELYEDGGGADAIPDMREATAGSINNQGGLTNGGEVAILYSWDGSSDLVQDLDYAIWGDADEAVDKTGVAIDGPDGGTDTSSYLNDTATGSQDLISASAHASGSSYTRIDLSEGTETKTGGNGSTGHNETSENLSVTWAIREPTPNEGVPVIKLVINEIIQNPSAVSDSAGEWFELYNPTSAAIDIDGWTIKDNDSDSHVINNGGPLLVPAGGYLLLGNNTDSGTNGGATVAYSYGGSFFLGNSGDELVLLDLDDNEIDRVEWDGGPDFPDPNGASMSLIGPGLDNNIGANWCEADTPFGAGDDGTPGAANVCAAQGLSLVINEIIQNPSAVSDSSGEWFELHNPSAAIIDIDGWTVKDDDADSHVINNGGPLLVTAGGYLVLGINDDSGTNGGVTVAYEYSTFFLGNSADEVVLLNGSLVEVDRVVYDGGPGFPDPNGASMSLINPNLDNNVAANWCEATTPFGAGDLGTPGAANDCPQLPPPPPIEIGACGDAATLISAVQGSGNASPLVGQWHVIEGVVVGDYQETAVSNPARPELQGFFVQEEDADNDADATTSEGVFVFDPAKTLELSEGDVVRVAGQVSEAFGNTQIDSVIDLLSCDIGQSVTPASVDLPIPALSSIDDFWEQYEGMLLSFVDTMTVTEQFELARFGQLVLSQGGELRQYSQDASLPLNEPDYLDWLDEQARRSIKLDDFNSQQNIDPVFHPQPAGFAVDNFIRLGATVNLQGVLEVRFGEWNLQPQKTAPVSFVNPARPVSPPALPGNVNVAAMNVLNYFNGDGLGGGFPTSRGADSQAELDRQTDKIVSAIVALDADVLGLMEIENDGDGVNDSLAYLVAAVNAVAGAGTYDYVPAGANGGTDEIKVSLIYKPAVVESVGTAQSLATAAFTDPNSTGTEKNRPALAQTFRVVDVANPDVGSAFTAVVLHLKSKGSGCGAPDDDIVQGNCNETRTKAAMELVSWLATDPTDTLTNIGVFDPDVFIVGDLNAYFQEDPMQVLYNAGYINLISQAEASYVFDGNRGSLDHILASPTLAAQMLGGAVWHINAEENSLLDYNDTIQDAGEASFEAKPPTNPLYAADSYRSSDHNPVLSLNNLADAPTVDSTAPADNATDVDLGSNIEISFAEAVNLTADAFTIECTETGTHTFVLSGGPTDYTLNPDIDFGLTETCTVTVIAGEVIEPVGSTPMREDYVFDFGTSANSRAVITVIKDFNDGNPGEVDVLLDCNTGLILDQDKTITEAQGVQFVVTQFDPTELDCTVTEAPVAGYETLYDNGMVMTETSCVFEEIMTTTVQNCVVHNHLVPVDVVVTKEWVISGLGDELPMNAAADYQCFNLANIDPEQCAADSVTTDIPAFNVNYLEFSGMIDSESFSLLPNWNGTTYCVVEERVTDDSVEADDSDCQNVAVLVGQESAGCTIINTRFFEGIPTLSQYGLAILALLMLGVGMVSFRRFS